MSFCCWRAGARSVTLNIQGFFPVFLHFSGLLPLISFPPVTIRHFLKLPFPFYFIYFHLATFLHPPPPPSLSSWPCYAAQCINSGMKNSQQRHGGIVDANDSELQEQRVKKAWTRCRSCSASTTERRGTATDCFCFIIAGISYCSNCSLSPASRAR